MNKIVKTNCCLKKGAAAAANSSYHQSFHHNLIQQHFGGNGPNGGGGSSHQGGVGGGHHPSSQQAQSQVNPYNGVFHEERFSRKVFVGGLPPDIDEDEIVTHFRRYGNLIVDWPHKAESKSYFPPKGIFILFSLSKTTTKKQDYHLEIV